MVHFVASEKVLTVIAFAGFEVFSVENFCCARIQQRINEKKKTIDMLQHELHFELEPYFESWDKTNS